MNETKDYKGFKIEMSPDIEPEDPRNWDNLGTMVCFHRRYELGDKHELLKANFDSWDEVKKHLYKELEAVIVLPLYLYDHSGLRIKVGSFRGLLPQGHAEFDSGQVGFIYATKKDIQEQFDKKEVCLSETEKILQAEVETYDKWLAGAVFNYAVEDVDGNTIDSCGGWYDFDDMVQEAKSVIDCEIEKRQKAHEIKLKAQIKHGTPLEKRSK